MDLVGHDFIGLGFDICGNSHDGIFVRSLLARGPARESGCIQAGDRIKSLNIIFDSVTLQDAYEILNCAAPYKMRLLLEKRVATTDKIADSLRSPAPMPLRRSAPRAYQQQQPIDTRQQLQESTSFASDPLNATRNYLRRLTNLVSPGGKTTQDVRARSKTPQFEPTFYLGSASARRYSDAGAHLNAAYGSDNDDSLTARELPTGGHISNLASTYNKASKSASVGLFSNSSAASQELVVDSSLEYHKSNANHRLHGPTLIGGVADNTRNLHLAGARELNAAGKLARRQSVDANSPIHHQQLGKVDQHLEQTQSQPQIAPMRAEEYHGMSRRQDDHHDRLAQQMMTRNANSLMANSMSTPAINFLSSSPSTSSSSSSSKQDEKSEDWRKLSSRRRRKERRESIREEVASDNSYADSTSKLVASATDRPLAKPQQASAADLSSASDQRARSTTGVDSTTTDRPTRIGEHLMDSSRPQQSSSSDSKGDTGM